ncbi:MAG TPA: protein kinase [Candidatus Blautia faecipullorum]|nr:protein kinase [Candidatus Blautia faecipullorum]
MDKLAGIWPEWQIVRKIGQGSYGTVYEAVRREHQVESRAAIKVISIPQEESEIESLRADGLSQRETRTYFQEIVNSFISEIQLMDTFKGVQNIVSINDYKVVERENSIGWYIYIRMELLTPLNICIRDVGVSESLVIKLGCDICTALELCAKRNVIHRDIKPENIFINDFGDFKLGDFGIARKLENLTSGLSRKGTYSYIAPEVEKGQPYNATVDIYSLGLVLYRFMNNNRMPFLDTEQKSMSPNARADALRRRLNGEPLPAPANASRSFAAVILRACSPEPGMRFQSAAEMKRALLKVSEKAASKETNDCPQDSLNETVYVRKAPQKEEEEKKPSPPKISQKQRPKTAAAVILAVLLLCVSGLAGGYLFLKIKTDSTAETVPKIVADIFGSDKGAFSEKEKSEEESSGETGTEEKNAGDELAEKADEDNKASEEVSSAQTDTEEPDAGETPSEAEEEEKASVEEAAENSSSEEKDGAFASTVKFERKTDDPYNEYGVVTGVSSAGSTVWTYTTGIYERTELNRVSEIGVHNGRYYMVEDGTVRVFNVKDGTSVWSNRDFGGCVSASAFDENDSLYLCGYYGPDLFIVDGNGGTINRVDSFDTQYVWPYELVLEDGLAAITFEGTPSGSPEVLYINLSSYSSSTDRETALGINSVTSHTETVVPQVSADVIMDVSATSYLEEPQYNLAHAPSNAIDGSSSTAWVESAAGQGEGEALTLTLNGVYRVSGFRINAGYQKSNDIYYKNSRPAALRVTFSDGSSTDAELGDFIGQQEITFSSAVDTSSVTFSILSVFPGSKYQDTAITEISLF